MLSIFGATVIYTNVQGTFRPPPILHLCPPDICSSDPLTLNHNCCHHLKRYKEHCNVRPTCRLNLSAFVCRNINVWSRLPAHVVNSDSVACSMQSCFVFLCFFRVFKIFLVGLATVVRLCLTSDIVLLIDWLYCINLFSSIAASLFNKLTLLYFICPS